MPGRLSVDAVLAVEGPSKLPVGENSRNGDAMSVLAYVLLTVAAFALLGVVLKLVERL